MIHVILNPAYEACLPVYNLCLFNYREFLHYASDIQ